MKKDISHNITAIIPARGGSKGIPNKNIKLLNGKPLIAYSIDACKKSKNINRIIVSTEDKEIAKIAESYGAEIPFLRPKKYSTDTSTDNGFLKHFFEHINVDEVALIRPTTPLRKSKIIDNIIKTYFSHKNNITGLRSMHITETPYKLFKLTDNNICTRFFDTFNNISNYSNLPRQSFPKTYDPNGYVDIVKKSTLYTGNIYGEKLYGYITNHITDIDNIEDFLYAEYQSINFEF